MAAIPFMPLYVADYMSDAAHLSTLEHGAYLLLIMTYWQRGEPLPDDDKKLARICRLGPREWQRVRSALSEFFQVDCGTWMHKRVDQELANVRDKSLKNRKAGLARAKQMHSGRSANAKPSDTDTDTDKKKEPKGSKKQTVQSLPDDWIPSQFGVGTKSRTITDGWTQDEWQSHLEHFTAHHRARGSKFKDWQDAWSTWVLNSAKYGRQANGASNRKNGTDGAMRALDRQLGLDGAAGSFGQRDTSQGEPYRLLPPTG